MRASTSSALIAILSATSVSLASAKDTDRLDPTEETLATLRAMRYSGPLPDLAAGYVVAGEVKSAGFKGGKDYSTAYRTKEGCVVFFSPPEKGQRDLGLRWEGPKCTGQPIKGEGTLTIGYEVGFPDGRTVLRVSVFRGRFENGMLQGKGEKANFTFEPDVGCKESIYSFEGDFADGLLDGVGRKTWTGPATGEPSTTVEEARFSRGTPQGEVIYSQLRPYPGVEAETKTLRYDSNGRPFLEQPDSMGAIFFSGEETGWYTKVFGLGSDWGVRGATFYRGAISYRGRLRHGEIDQAAGCMAWSFQADGLRCEGEGLLTWRSPNSSHRLEMFRRPFMIPIPVKTFPSPFRVQDQEVFALRGRPSETDELTCSPDLASCRGTAILEIAGRVYFLGKVEYENGELLPVSGVFLQAPGINRTPGKDEKLASCQVFRSPTRCRSGWVKRGGEGSWTGGFEVTGLAFEARRGYVLDRSPFGFAMEGEGRFRWKASGEWADVRADENRITSVQRCGHDGRSGEIPCYLKDGTTVVFGP